MPTRQGEAVDLGSSLSLIYAEGVVIMGQKFLPLF
jgi:hypothetical protein